MTNKKRIITKKVQTETKVEPKTEPQLEEFNSFECDNCKNIFNYYECASTEYTYILGYYDICSECCCKLFPLSKMKCECQNYCAEGQPYCYECILNDLKDC